jgi:type VI secretion system secreted protein VgrG
MSGKEELGRLPEFQLDFVSRRGDIKPEEILGKNVTWTVELADGGQRYFNGFVTSFADNGESHASVFETGGKGMVYLYVATLHPWLWFLTRASNCRIFQNLSVPEIVDQVFKGYKFADTRKIQLGAGYPKKEFCVQYRETDFNFVCRLLEQEGIYFAYEYDDGKNTLVLMDSQGAHKTLPKLEVPFHQDMAALREKDCYGSWSAEREIQPGRYLIDDYDCMTPRVAMLGDGLPEIKKTHDLADFEIYDYPGEYDKPAEGTQYAKTRIEELHTKYESFFGAGNARHSAPGRLLKLQDHTRSSYNAEYLLTRVNYAATAGSLASGGDAAMFSCNVVAISSKAIFRPARLTPKPIVQGTQTAFVVGPAGEEIYTDEYGRIKVQFHWDRYSKTDENSSCWVRVSQPLAGKEWGFVTIPRIGQEVLVDFLEGDPDHPVVIGALYNGEAKPAFKLPDDKSRSGFKSKSYKGTGFNELRFEDKAGAEEIYLHAQKDQSALVEHDRIEKLGNESHLIVGKDALEKLGGDHHVEVAGDRNEKLGGGLSLKIGKDMQAKLGTKLAYDAGTEIHLKAGTTLVLEASASLSLHVGGNFITLNSGGVFIKGTMVMINSGGAAGNGSGASPQPPKPPKEAAQSKGGEVTQAPTRQKPTAYSPQAQMFKMAADSGTPFCDVCNC